MSKPAARVGDMHTCPMVTPGVPPVPHVGGPITGPGVPTVLIGNMPAAVIGDMCTCVGPPASIILGSTGVLIGNKPAARMGDMTAHGGTIVLGCPTVLIGEISPGTVVTKTAVTILEQFVSGAGGSAGAASETDVEHRLQAARIAEQILTMQQAADIGKPFCAICAKMARDKIKNSPESPKAETTETTETTKTTEPVISVADQETTMLQAADNGQPFCEICNQQANAK